MNSALADPAHRKHRRAVADAHLGAAIQAADQVTVLTSDPGGMQLMAGRKPIEVITL